MNYESANAQKRAKIVQDKYDAKQGDDIYATSRDINLRELEIDFILESIRKYAPKNPAILDIGCGNGYTDIRIAQEIKCKLVGIDFSQSMIAGAKHLSDGINCITFLKGDVRHLNWAGHSFDIVISERCLLNLPNEDIQHEVIQEVHRVLKRGGIYIMVEGSRTGLRNLNRIRVKLGLHPIPDRTEDNLASLKFEEPAIQEFLSKYFNVLHKQHFGMYYLISRVIHPLLVAPDEPKFDAKINEIARRIASLYPGYQGVGHIVGYILRK